MEERQFAAMMPGSAVGYVVQYPCPLGPVELAELPPRLCPVLLSGTVGGSPRHTIPASTTALPFANGSIAAAVLPHTLEADAPPSIIVAEAARVLEPEGCLLMSGFNPWSLFGLLQLRPRPRREEETVSGPWAAHFRSLWRMRRHLDGEGLEIEQITTLFYRLPLGTPWALRDGGVMERFGPRLMPQRGGIYFVLARKRVVAPTFVGFAAPNRIRPREILAPGSARHGLFREVGPGDSVD